MTYTPPTVATDIPVGSTPILVATTAQVGGSGQLVNAGQLPCWYGTTNGVTPSTGTLLPPGGAPVLLTAGNSYYCVAVAGQPTSVVANTWTSNIPGATSSSGTGVTPLITPVGIQAASGGWSAATSTTVSLNPTTNIPLVAGDLVLVGVNEFNFNAAPPNVTSMTDTNGNTWTKVKNTATTATGITNAGTEIWQSVLTTGGATTLTVNISAAVGSGQITAMEWQKTLAGSWSIDVSGTNSTGASATGNSSIAAPPLKPSQLFELCVFTFANTGTPGSAVYPTGYLVTYPFVYNNLVSSPQSPAITVQNNVVWATVGVCISVFSPTGNATQLQGNAVSSTAPTTNQILAWNGTNWVPTAPGSGNATSIQGNAVSAAAPTNGQGLVWNGTNWVPTTLSTANATSIQGVAVSATAPTSGQGLVYNGTNWLPTTLSAGGVGEPLGINLVSAATGTLTLAAPASAQINQYEMTGALTLTMPPLVAGDWCYIWVDQPPAGVNTLSWAASPPIRWVGGSPATAPAGSTRLFVSCICDGTNWVNTIVSNSF